MWCCAVLSVFSRPQLDWRFVKQVWRVTKIAFVSHKQQATLLALAMLVTAIGGR